jgi:hypothetical protein
MDIKKLDEKYYKQLKYQYKKNIGDTEVIHIEYDQILLNLLNEIGFNKVVKEFNDHDFWYA